MDLTARVVRERGAYWAEVSELPGCFASGETLDELMAALREAIALYVDDCPSGVSLDGLKLALA
jgi:predicted RNase H-like HicB family nuclease